MIRRPPRSTLFPTRRSSDLEGRSAAPGARDGEADNCKLGRWRRWRMVKEVEAATSTNLHNLTDLHRLQLEQPPRPHLQLPRIAQPRADRAVEVEEQAAVGRVLEVVLVGDV